MVTIKLELDIAAQRFAQHIQLHNQEIEKQIEEGIKKAMEELTKDNYLVEAVREATKEEVLKLANKNVLSWEMRTKMKEFIESKLSEKLNAYSEEIAEKVYNSLKQ